MANYCNFEMRVKGRKENILNLYNAMNQEGQIWVGRGMCVENGIEYIVDDEEKAFAKFEAQCKWSIGGAFFEDALSMRRNPKLWCFGEDKPKAIITLAEASGIWDLTIESISSETGCAVAEHYMCINGRLALADTEGLECHYIEGCETKEEAEELCGFEISDEDWEERDAFIEGENPFEFELV